ncbi:trehalose-6-phosphate synthase [Alcaligenes faecalis]|uniref:alpha,alpha-trehalose-phosphate synthase (UDP-forming) n=1 Tax=Alcaligenes faecalis TaxID=511 RepID=UPI0035572540
MSKIIVVSVRVASSDQPCTGGLAVAVDQLLKRQRTQSIWLGWNGQCDSQPDSLRTEDRGSYQAVTFSFTQEQYEQFYCGYANTCLWPAFHYRLDLMDFQTHHFQQYLEINRQIAAYLSQIADEDDLIWVHDYHLMPLAHFWREQGMQQAIGLFFHTPFPCPEILRSIPRYEQWLPMLRHYDQIGVQSRSDHSALTAALQTLVPPRASDPQARAVRTDVYPISIDIDLIQALAKAPSWNDGNTPIEPVHGPDTIISVDRLDYTKGLAYRLRILDTLLRRYPTLHGQTTYVQIAPSTRGDIHDYQVMREELESLAGQINGQFATPGWSPVVYMNRAFPAGQLMRMLRRARVGFIAPLRDGMNLVAKEYIAAQDPDDPGVLVLSTFTGAAQSLQGGYLPVNPYDADASANSLYQALNMSLEERRRRHQHLLMQLRRQDLGQWCEQFLHDLSASSGSNQAHSPLAELPAS